MYNIGTAVDTPSVVLRSLFLKYDTDNSNSIDKRELFELCYDLGYFMDDLELTAVMNQLDVDNSGDVQFEEFEKWWQDNDKFRLFKGGADSHKLQEAIRLFKSVDSDRNGTLDLEEYKKLCEQLGQVGLPPERYQAGLKELDTDGDGKISFNEFLNWLNWF